MKHSLIRIFCENTRIPNPFEQTGKNVGKQPIDLIEGKQCGQEREIRQNEKSALHQSLGSARGIQGPIWKKGSMAEKE